MVSLRLRRGRNCPMCSKTSLTTASMWKWKRAPLLMNSSRSVYFWHIVDWCVAILTCFDRINDIRKGLCSYCPFSLSSYMQAVLQIFGQTTTTLIVRCWELCFYTQVYLHYSVCIMSSTFYIYTNCHCFFVVFLSSTPSSSWLGHSRVSTRSL